MTDRNHLTVHIYNYDKHMIVHMTGLYSTLVTYIRLHILTLVFLFSWYQLYIVHRFILDIDYFVIFYFSLSCCSCLCYYARASFSLHTHTLIRSLLMTLESHIQDFRHFLILFRCSCDRKLHEELEFISFDYCILLSCLPVIFWFLIYIYIYQIQSLFLVFLYDIMCGCLYVI